MTERPWQTVLGGICLLLLWAVLAAWCFVLVP